jgi:transcriptional regulator GlxA family with amidase domain
MRRNADTRLDRTRRMVIVGSPNAQLLDIAGPFDVFACASQLYLQQHPRSAPPYSIELVSTSPAPSVRTTSGLEIAAATCYTAARGTIDTLLVAGGSGKAFEASRRDPEMLQWLCRAAKTVRRLGAICTGAFVLAEAGLLDGRRATTHWSLCRELALRYPAIRVDPDPIFICDRGVYTSAGVTAGIDLALALVDEDLGPKIAMSVARELVMYVRRPGGQAQLSAALALQIADRRSIRELQSWLVDHLTGDLSVQALANRTAMSPRHFARVFAEQTGLTPARFVELIRVEAARRRLEESADTVDQIATECGFRSADSMRRAFRRLLRVTPTAYRVPLDRARNR